MRTGVFIFILFSLVLSILGQDKQVRLNKEFFLVGTMNDYMGRQLRPDTKNRVDQFYKSELLIALKIDSLFRADFPGLQLKCYSDSSRIELFSNELSEIVNSFYTFLPSGTLNLSNDTIYTGSLRADKFVTDEQKKSFITGAYIRYGEKTDSIYCINIANSVSKTRLCTEFLKELKSENVEYKILTGYIPTSHKVYFKPTEDLKKYFAELSYLEEAVHKEKNETIRKLIEMIGEENYKKIINGNVR